MEIVMTHAAIIEEMVLASASMDIARDAAERGDWPKAEQALLGVQERSARLLRELGLQGGSAEPPKERPRPEVARRRWRCSASLDSN